MSATPKRRLKPKLPPPSPPSSSSTSSRSSLKSTITTEPPPTLFPAKDEFLKLVTVLVIASTIAFACNFVVNTFIYPSTKPFCDSHFDAPDAITDNCEPCPSHGECHQGRLECFHGYRKYGKTCVEDGDINETARKLAQWIENRLCEACALAMCDGKGVVWVKTEDIWKDLDDHPLMKNFGWDRALYLYTKQKAMEALEKLLEARTNSIGGKELELKCPDSMVEYYKPYSCRVRQWILEHAMIIMPVFALLVGLVLLIRKVHRERYISARVDELYHQVCDILEESAVMSKGGNGECEPWVVASRLRDHLLLPKERKDPVLWKKVEELIQEDSRVDRYPKLVKGESKVVWEWQAEGSLSSSKLRERRDRGKLRFSSSPDADLISEGSNLRTGKLLNF